MHLIYIDESKDITTRPRTYIYTALCIHENVWRDVFSRVKDYRAHLRKKYGIYIKQELHACDFLAGKGWISDRVIKKPERAEIFQETIEFIAALGGSHDKVCLYNSICHNEEWAFERIVTRFQNSMSAWNSQAVLLFDEGEEAAFRNRIRKMNVFNPIPSRYQMWGDTGGSYKNIKIDRIIEDPIFKQSHESYFIQLVDFCAFALLRKEKPLASKTALGIHTAFDKLKPLCHPKANLSDPMGVIR